MKRSGFLWVFIGFPLLMMAMSFCLPLLTRLKSETLPLHIVSWSWRGKVEYRVRVVDLDADGQDEIVFYDNGWWWGEWDGKPPAFQKIPIPIQAEEGISRISNLPSNIFAAHPDPYDYVPPTPVPAPSSPPAPPMGFAPAGPPAPPAIPTPPVLSAPLTPAPNTSRLVDIWLVTRAKEQWKVVLRKIYISITQSDPSVFVGDWDKDGRANECYSQSMTV